MYGEASGVEEAPVDWESSGLGDSFLPAPCVDEEKLPPFSSTPCAHA